jgi:hypothetical protein
MVIYRKDQKIALKHLIPNKLESIPKFYDYIIASQAFRLRSPYERTLKLVLIPLLKMLDVKGQLFFIYSSGNDFSKKLLKLFFPKIITRRKEKKNYSFQRLIPINLVIPKNL